MGAGQPLLICYDGSDGARAALATAASLFAGREAVVACYWQPFVTSSGRLAINVLELVADPASINERESQLAHEVAEEGARLARAEGLAATGAAMRIEGPIDEAILRHADELDAAAIVLGARGSSALRSVILGDIAKEVVQRATRPVVLVPSADLAQRRRAGEGDGTADRA